MAFSRRFVATLAFVTLALSLAGLAEASVNAFWRELAGSASGGGVSKTPAGSLTGSASVAAGLDGRPVVAYSEVGPTDDDAEGRIVVKRWTGAAWQTLSPAGGVGSRGYGAQIKIAPDGTMYAAWLGYPDNQVHLRRRTATGTVWEQLSNSDGPLGLTGLNASIIGSFSLAVASDSTPVIAFTAPAQAGVSAGTSGILLGEYQAYVVQHTSSGWQYLGTSPFDGGGASNAPSLLVDGGNAYAVHSVGRAGEEIRLAIDSADRPVVAFLYTTAYPSGPVPPQFQPPSPGDLRSDVYVTRFEANTSTWTAVGPAVPLDDDGGAARGGPGGISETLFDVSFVGLAAAPAGDRLYLVWGDLVGAGDTRIYFRRWNGVDAWEDVNGSSSDDGLSGPGVNLFPTVAADGNSNAIVAWSHGLSAPGNHSEIYVLRSNSFDEWVEMGPDSAAGDGISGNPASVFASQPAIAYFDGPSDTTSIVWVNSQPGANAQAYLRQFSEGLTTFPLTVTVTPGNRVFSTPVGIDCPDDACTELFPSGQVVSLTAVAGPDHLFDRFLGACTGATCNVLMNANRSVNASFVGAGTLTVVKDGLGTVTGTGISCGTDCSEKYRVGTVVNLVASMPAGTLFGGWGGACLFRGTNASCPLTITGNQTVTADFTQRVYQLQVTVDNPAGTVVNGVGGYLEARAGGSPLFTCDYDEGPCVAQVEHGQPVELKTFDVGGNRFVSYAGAPCAGRTNATCPFTMLANYSITALLRGVTAIQVNKLGNGAGKGTVTGPSISCGNDCLGEAFTGTPVVISQTPGVGNRLVGFNGPCSGPTCSFLATGPNQSVDVTYQLNRHALFVTGAPGTTQGYSLSTPSGIDCGNFGGHFDCTETFDYGTSVTVTAIPDTNSRFLSWAGCSRVNGPVCQVDMTSNRTLTKAFGAARTLFVSGSGNGRGVYTVPGQPSLVCQGNCSTSYLLPFNQPVVITPRPDTGSNFRWISGCSVATGACTQLMSQNRTTVGEFRLNRHRIVVTDRANGSVTSNVFPDSSAIDCGSGSSICTSEQDYNTLVTLQAVPDEGNIFVNWTGTSPCSAAGRATNASCSFQLQGNVTLIPNYRAATIVDLFKDGNGQGSIGVTGTLAPAAPVCGPTCSSTRFTAFDSRPVILKATPSLGSRFVTYGGDCVSNSSTCTYIPGGANDSITATFVLQQFDLTVPDRHNGTVTGTIPGNTQVIGCGSGGDDCSETLDFNTEVTLAALANPDFLFVSWSGDAVCAGKTTNTCSFRMPNRHVNVVPVYRARTLVTFLKDGNGLGTVTATGTLLPAAPVCGPTCLSTQFFAFDSKAVTLRATPSLGSSFVAFQGGCGSNSSTCTFTPGGANETVTGTFVLQQFALNVTDRANGTVTGTTTLGTVIECGSGAIDCSETVDFSTDVVLGAVANADALFVSWAGDAVCAGKTTSTCSFKMPNRVVNVTPVYRARTVITLVKDGNGSGGVAATGTLAPAAPVCGPTCSGTTFAALDGKLVTLRATPSLGSRFIAFLGGCASNASTCTYVPSGANDTVTARFTLQQFALNVTDRPNGTVTGTTSGGTVLECGSGGNDCTETLDFSTDVVLGAAPNTDAIFVSWTGDAVCAGKTNSTCTFKMPNRVVTVTPVYRTRTVVGLLKDGDGQGTLTATGTLSPAAPTCGPTCPGTSFLAFDSRAVTLRATPSIGSVFTGFTGDCVSNSSTCTYFPSGGNDTVTGSFARQSFTLNVTSVASGLVTGSIGPTQIIDCGGGASVCTANNPFGEPIVLVADANDGFVFVSWAGDAVCAGKTNSSCTFALPNRTVTVTPVYRRESVVTVFPDGQGTVTGTGISCVSGAAGVTGDCSQTITNGASLTLTATPATGWDFSFWDDASCNASPGAVCTFTPAADSVQVFPVFVREARSAAVIVSGNGSVVSGFDQCDNTSSPCTFDRQFGDTVILTATPAAGFDFISWTGCQSTNGSACTLLMTANRTATVTFLPTAAASIAVGQGGLVFSSPDVTITVGQTVRWTWATSNHNVVSGTNGVADGQFCNPSDVNCATAPLVGPPTVYSHTFNSPGTFTYFCRQHRLSGMTGTITVNE